jgi:hypothetical protein
MNPFKKFKALLFTAILVLGATCSFAQYTTIDEARDYINDRLTHSMIQKIEANGTVTISSPGSKYKFNLRDASFNYNGGNDDDRVRVFCDNCIEKWENKQLKEKLNRQSFVCDTELEANEVITAFRFIKKTWPGSAGTGATADKKLKIQDITLGLNTVNDAINFINDNLSFSMVSGIDEKGIMTINAPDDIYIVDLAKAEFGYNDSGSEPQVRIYGDFCVALRKDNGKLKYISRNSFQAASRSRANKVITVLYYLRSTYSGFDPSKISGLRNVSGTKTMSYKTAAEAIDFINDRLSYSIIMELDKNGMTTINAPEDIYRFAIKEVKLSKTDTRRVSSDWFNLPIPGDYSPGLLIECNDCLKRFNGPEDYNTMDEQVFQCRNMTDAKDVVKAMIYLKGTVK